MLTKSAIESKLPYSKTTQCDVTETSQIATSVTIITVAKIWYFSLVSLGLSVIVIWWLHCVVILTTDLWGVTRWSYNEIICWLSNDCHLVPPVWSRFDRLFLRSQQLTSTWYNLVTCHKATVLMTSQWSLQITVTRES